MTSFPACNLCGSRDAAVLYPASVGPATPVPAAEFACTSPHLAQYDTIVRCASCGLVYSVGGLAPDAVLENYGEVEDPTYLIEEQRRREAFDHSLDLLERYTPPGRLVEVGAHVGLFLDVAQRRGWNVVGVEPSRWAVETGRRRFGVDLRVGDLQSARLPAASFDVVAMWDVLEHFSDPLAELREAHRLLRPGGILALTTVNIASPHARLTRGRWPWLMRMHLFYFTPRTLRTYLERAGFDVAVLSSQGRVFSLDYLAWRLGLHIPAARKLRSGVRALRLGGVGIPINLGDILLTIGRARAM